MMGTVSLLSRCRTLPTPRTSRTRWRVGAGIALACAASGATSCRDSEPKATGATGSQAAREIDVAAINALVPATLQPALVFDKRDVSVERGPRKTTYTLAAPRGWEQRGGVVMELVTTDRTGERVRLVASSSCDGECKPKSWEAIVDRVHFAPRAKGKVLKDEKAPGRRTLIAEGERRGVPITYVTVAWWTDGARSYHYCAASLTDAFKAAVPAFEKVCQAVTIEGGIDSDADG